MARLSGMAAAATDGQLDLKARRSVGNAQEQEKGDEAGHLRRIRQFRRGRQGKGQEEEGQGEELGEGNAEAT